MTGKKDVLCSDVIWVERSDSDSSIRNENDIRRRMSDSRLWRERGEPCRVTDHPPSHRETVP